MKFPFLFEVEEEHNDGNAEAGDETNDGDDERGPDGGEEELGSGNAAVGDVELGVGFSGGFDEFPVDAVVVVGVGEVG